jgi:hypothetical protein
MRLFDAAKSLTKFGLKTGGIGFKRGDKRRLMLATNKIATNRCRCRNYDTSDHEIIINAWRFLSTLKER